MTFVHGAVLWKSPVSDSATGAREVEVKAFGKISSTDWPFNVANEYLASQIANRVGGLPIPVGAVVEGQSGQSPAWVSLAFSSDKPPPVDAAQLVADLPDIAAGITVFDVLIANQDRHAGNLRYAASRKQAYAFDHSHSLLGTDPDIGAHLNRLKDNLAIHQSQPNRHCLIDHLDKGQLVLGWADELHNAISHEFLRRVTDELFRLDLGVSREDCTRVFAFLSHRRDNLQKLIRDNTDQFKSIPDDDWGLI